MRLDMPTLIFTFVISHLLCTGMLIVLWLQNRRRVDGPGWWLAGYLTQFAGIILVGAGELAPPLLSTVGGNTLGLIGNLLIYTGLLHYLGKPTRQPHNLFLLVIFVPVHAYFTLVKPDPAARAILASTALGILYIQSAWLLLVRVTPVERLETGVAGAVYVLFCLVAAGRVIFNFNSNPAETQFLQRSVWFETASILLVQILFIALTFSLMLMVNRRLTTAMRADNDLLKTLITSMGEGMAVVDPQERFVLTNPVAAQIFGLPTGALTGHSLEEFLSPEQIHYIRRQTEVRRRGQTSHYQLDISRTDGGRRTLQVTASPNFTPKGDFSGGIAIFRDITESARLSALQAFLAGHEWLQTGEEFFTALARFLAGQLEMDIVLISRLIDNGLAAQTQVVFSDGQIQKNFTYQLKDTPCEQVLNQTASVFPSGIQRLFPNDRELVEMAGESYAGVPLWGKESRPVGLIVLIGRQPLMNPQIVKGVLEMAAVRSASEMERLQAEESLRWREELFRGVVNNTRDGIAIIANDGRLVEWNPAMEAITGIPAQKAFDRFIWDIQAMMMVAPELGLMTHFSDEAKAYSLHLLSETGELAEPYRQVEWPFRRMDGALRYAEQSVYPVDIAGSRLFCSAIRDISARKQAEQALQDYAAEQALLFAVSSAAAAWLERDELLAHILEALSSHLEQALAWVYTPGPPPALEASHQLDPDDQQRLVEFHRLDCAASAAQTTINHAGLLDLLGSLQFSAGSPLFEGTTCSAITIPLSAGESRLGCLGLAWGRPRPFNPQTQATLETAGQQVTIALHNAALFQTARQADRLRTINRISAAVTSSLDLQVILRQALETLAQATSADGASILRLLPETGELVFEATLAYELDILVGQKIDAGEGLAGWIVQHRQSLLVPDAQQDPRHIQRVTEITGVIVNGLIGAPLVYQGVVKGVIMLIKTGQGQFTPDDLALLEAAASVTAVALENARLFDDASSRAQELHTLHSLSQAMAASLDSAAILDTTLGRLQTLLEADFVGYFPIDTRTGQPMLGATAGIAIHSYFQNAAVPASTISRWLVQHQRAFSIPCAGEDERMRSWVAQFPELHQASVLLAPMLDKAPESGETNAAVAGGLCAIRFVPPPFSADDLHQLEAVASVLNVVLKNAQLYEDLQMAMEERKRTQNQLILSEKVSALGRLAASLAHEINNPLQSVKGCLSLLEEELAGRRDPQKIDRFMQIVSSEIERVVRLVRGMSEFYRSSRQQAQTIDLHAMLNDLLALSDRQLHTAGIQVETRLAAEAPRISANPDHVKQVFMNLILNAADAMPDGGKLRITTDLLPPAGPHALPRVVIQVCDTGHGIPAETLKHIFDPFFTTKEHGSGLGLYVTHEIIRSYDGQIDVSSQSNQGTVFTITLPAL